MTSNNGIWWNWEYKLNSTSGHNDTYPLVYPGIPEINSSGNLGYMVGDSGYEVAWIILDSTILEPSYWLYLDGVEIQTASWTSLEYITFDVGGHSPGTYTYLLTVNDGTAWGWNESQIVLNVAEVPIPDITTSSQTIFTPSISVGWSDVEVDSYNVYVNGTLANSTDTLGQIIWLNETGYYSITVTSIYGAEESEHSDPIVINVKLIPPDSPIITTLSQTINQSINLDDLSLQWLTVARADSYKIYVNGTLNGTATSLAKQIEFIANGEYVIMITSVNKYGESDPSDPITIIVDIPAEGPGGGGAVIPGYSPIMLLFILILYIGIFRWFFKKKTKL